MDTQRKKGLLEICVLAVLQREPSYGYKIIGDITPCIDISESTLYPILKRLETAGVTADKIKVLSDVQYIPYTTKADLRDTYPFGMFSVPRKELVRVHASSGTTGVSPRFSRSGTNCAASTPLFKTVAWPRSPCRGPASLKRPPLPNQPERTWNPHDKK